jgi:altronate dehydratase
MPYKLEWYQEERIAYFELIGDVTAGELETACTRLRDEYLDTGTPPIHVIVDPRGINSHPNDVRAIHRATQLYAEHKNLGWLLIIGVENRVSIFLANIALQSFKRNFRMVASLEDADAVLQRVDIGTTTQVS